MLVIFGVNFEVNYSVIYLLWGVFEFSLVSDDFVFAEVYSLRRVFPPIGGNFGILFLENAKCDDLRTNINNMLSYLVYCHFGFFG